MLKSLKIFLISPIIITFQILSTSAFAGSVRDVPPVPHEDWLLPSRESTTDYEIENRSTLHLPDEEYLGDDSTSSVYQDFSFDGSICPVFMG